MNSPSDATPQHVEGVEFRLNGRMVRVQTAASRRLTQVLREELSRTRRSQTETRRFSRPSGGHLAGYQRGTARRDVHVARVCLARTVDHVAGPSGDGKDSFASWVHGFVADTRRVNIFADQIFRP